MAISAKHTKFVSSAYVNALPAEDFIKVALKKQEMYDEGRKQIKQNLDNYGKLRNTIINENERNYFDQELNKLVKNVQQNAGLDFSNMNNVEAVINLGKPFENDEYIKTALDNGIEYQRRQKELASISKDKRNADNDLVYMYDAQKHMESGGLGQKLAKNKTYAQYVDVKKKLSDIEKEVQGEMQTLYREGPKGYIEKIDIERKTREAIEARMMSNLTGEEMAQVQIHAQAQMYRLGPDVLYQTWVGHNKEEMLMAEQRSKEAMQVIGAVNAIKKPTAEQLNNLKQAQEVLTRSQKVIAAAKENVSMNPDDFDLEEYVPFFTSRFISGIAGSQVKEVIKSELKEDKVYIMDRQHQQTLTEISARSREERRNLEYKQELEYTTQVGASTNLLKGISKVIKEPTGATGSAKVRNIIDQINENKNIKESTKKALLTQLEVLEKAYEAAQDNQNNDNYTVSFNRNLGGGYTTSVNDFLTSDPLQLIESGAINSVEVRKKTATTKDSKTPKEIQEEAKAKKAGELEAIKDNPDAAKLLYGDKDKKLAWTPPTGNSSDE